MHISDIVAASALHSAEGLQKGLEWLDHAIYRYQSKSVILKQNDKSKSTTDKHFAEQFTKKSLAFIKKLFLINVDSK